MHERRGEEWPDADYYRRRADRDVERRLTNLETSVDKLEQRMAQVLVLGAAVVVLASIVGPTIAGLLLKSATGTP